MNTKHWTGADYFDGQNLISNAIVESDTDGRFLSVVGNDEKHAVGCMTTLDGGIICAGFVDLQVNGGGGVLFNDQPDYEGLVEIAAAHRKLGCRAILPTLITDDKDVLIRALEAVKSAKDLPEIAGIHLEGPHLSLAKKGAHDPKFIRKMDADDVNRLVNARQEIPVILMTIAPENVTLDQVRQLVDAGITLSLGHTDCTYETAMAYFEAGVQMCTHLFNAMSGLSHREPGLVGAFLNSPKVASGLIADGVHVHEAAIKIAQMANEGGLFLVSDCMSVAGTTLDRFTLNGREILRQNGTLTLEDGTLAGADLDMLAAIKFMVKTLNTPLQIALEMATSRPSRFLNPAFDHRPLLWISDDLTQFKWL